MPTPGVPEKITVPAVSFLGEQDGPFEQQLKSAIVKILEPKPQILEAYLARLHIRDSPTDSVALCLWGTGDPDVSIVEAVGRSFAQLFAGTQFLDTLFLTEGQRDGLMRVCRPFFIRGD